MTSPESPTPPLSHSPIARPTLGRLLVVDDEVELKNALCDMLPEHGYEVAGFTSGQEALQALTHQDFDLLLADLMMPEMDGITLLRTGLEIDPNLVGIIMTGQGTVQTAVEAMKIGAFDYVLKPFKLQAVLPILSRAMGVRRLRLENVQLRESVAIYELSMAIAFTLDEGAILSKVADAALQQCQADEASVMLPTTAGNELYVAVVRGERPRPILGERVPIHQGVAGWVASQRQPLTLQGEVTDPRFTPIIPRPEIAAAISMPMLVAGRLVGVLNVNATDRRRSFRLGQVKALSILAGIAASALENARLLREVRAAEEKYRSIFENAVEGIFQTTREGQFVTANPALARIYGYDSPRELMAAVKDIRRQLYVDPDRRTEFMRLLQERGSVFGFESQMYRRDGGVIWISENAHGLYDAQGRLFGYEGMVVDITERKRAEEALQRSVERLETLRQIDLAILAAQSPQEIGQAALRHIQRLVPCQRASVVVLDYESREALMVATQGIPQTGVSGTGRAPLEDFRIAELQRGEIHVVEDTLSLSRPMPIIQALQAEGIRSYLNIPLIAQGALIGTLFVGADSPGAFTREHLEITQEVANQLAIAILQARLREQVQRHAAELEQRVAERTQELATANRQLAEASRHKSEFLANMSHELRTPLNAVIGFSELLLGQGVGPLTEKQERYLGHIHTSGKHLLQLISDVLDLSKVEAGMISLELQSLPVATALEEILVIARGLANKKGQIIETAIEPNLPHLQADPVRFKQILFNLLSNAVKFTPDGGLITVTARTVTGGESTGAGERRSGGADESAPQPPGYPLGTSAPLHFLEIRVTDTGAGIRAEDLPKLFGEFVQLETTRAQRHEGSGLGLALTKRLVELRGGRIWAASEGAGCGSTFTVVLPFGGPGT